MRQKTVSLYQFDELSEQAKDRAREWFRSCGGPEDFEYVIEDAERMLTILGFNVYQRDVPLMNGKTRKEPRIFWQVGYMQSDGAGFEGSYGFEKDAPTAIRTEAPEDTELHRIADELHELQARYAHGLGATIREDRFFPEVELEQTEEGPAISTDDYRAFKELIRSLYRWIYKQLRTEDEYRSADEQVDEAIRANEYEFDAHGNRED